MPITSTPSSRGEAGDRAHHRHAVIAAGSRSCRRAARRCRCTAKPSSVASISAPRPRRPSTTAGDAVGLLDAQLLRARARPSRPRRSSRAARPAAARRSPAGPPRRSTTVPSSAPWATSRSLTGSSGDELLALLLEVAEHDAAHPPQDPQEARAGPVDADVARSAAASRARARRRRSGTRPSWGRRELDQRSSSSSSALTTVTWRPLRWIEHAGAQQHPLGVVAAARRLAHGRRAVGGERRRAARRT